MSRIDYLTIRGPVTFSRGGSLIRKFCFSLISLWDHGVVPAEDLNILNAYTNRQYNTHAYCENILKRGIRRIGCKENILKVYRNLRVTPACVSQVASSGFTASKTPIGRVIAPNQAALAAAKAACPDVPFYPLGFTKKGNGYMHDLHGNGIQVGYVPYTAGCGATLPMKAYNPAVGDDIWYTTGFSNLKPRHSGKPIFHVWSTY